jgi:hypothetical protein
MQEAERAVKYAGQMAGVGIGALQQTFLPSGSSDLAKNSWITRIAGGLTGATPQLPNLAGKNQNAAPPESALPPPAPSADSAPPRLGTGAGRGAPAVHIENYNVGTTEDKAGQDLARHHTAPGIIPGDR